MNREPPDLWQDDAVHDAESGSPLDVLIDAAREQLHGTDVPAPAGLADVFARARVLDASLMLPVDEAARLDALGDDALDRVARIGSLETLVASARAELSAAADLAGRHGSPPMRVPEIAAHRARPSTVRVAIAAIAAVLVAVLAVRWGMDRASLDDGSARDYSGANQTAAVDPRATAEIVERPASHAGKPAPAPASPPELEPPPEDEAVPAIDPPGAAAAKPARRAPIAPAVTIETKLDALDADARAAWRRGDLAAAERAFESMLRTGGQRAIVDLAFGDLFELARQRHDADAEAALWKRYLRRFPGGRYIDEARAGLCRRASGDAAMQCWQDYLDHRPRGPYRDQARAALGIGGK